MDLEECIASKFNVEFERVNNEFKLQSDRASDEKARLEHKLSLAKEKHDKVLSDKKALDSEKDKLEKKAVQLKLDIEDKLKKLEMSRKKISTLEQ